MKTNRIRTIVTKSSIVFAIVVAIVIVGTAGFIMMVTSCEREAPEPRAVRERICFICRTADNQIRNGYDLVFYSDDGSTETATLDGATGNLSLDGALTSAGAQTVNNDLTLTGTLYSNVEILTIGDSVIITGTLMSDGETVTIGDSAAVTGTLDVSLGITATENISAGTGLAVSGPTVLHGSLTMSDTAFSGPIMYNLVPQVVSGTIVYHGMGTTPTVVLLTPILSTTNEITACYYVLTLEYTNFVIGHDAAGGDGVYWIAGR